MNVRFYYFNAHVYTLSCRVADTLFFLFICETQVEAAIIRILSCMKIENFLGDGTFGARHKLHLRDAAM